MNGDLDGEPVREQIGYWLPVLVPEDRPAVKRILEWKIIELKKLYRFIEAIHWIETPEDELCPPSMGWKVYAEEIK